MSIPSISMKKFASHKKLIVCLLLLCICLTVAGCGCGTSANLDEDGNYIRNEDSTCAKLVGVIMEFFHKILSYIHLYNYAWSILLLTILVKVVTTPLNIKQQKSMKAMQKVNPAVQELSIKYADDPQKKSEEMSKLYKENNVSPAAGCLPMLIQMPILFILFYGMRNWMPDPSAIADGLYSFFWIDDLSLTVKLTPYKWVLPILCGLITMGQQFMATSNREDTSQKMMLFLMPVMFLFITPSFPSALALYWVFYGLATAIQQTWLNYRLKTGFFTPKEERMQSRQTIAELKAKQKEKESRTHESTRYTTTHNKTQGNQNGKNANNNAGQNRINDKRDKPWH